MTNEYIAFYVSSHGFGHLTRSLALIEHILLNTSYNIYLCTDITQVEFGKIYLERFGNRTKYSVKPTDVGLINRNNSLDVDKKQTEKEVIRLLKSYRDIATDEISNLKKYSVKLIVSDISALAFLIGDQILVKVIGISNFLWVDQYLSVDVDTDIIEELKKIYNKGTYFIKYDLSLKFTGIPLNLILQSDYLVSRPIVRDRVESIIEECQNLYKEKTKESNKPEILYLSLGKSAQLPPIRISNFQGIIIYTEGINIQGNNKNIVFIKLPNEIKDSQSYIAASDLAIAKAGWSTTAESLVAHSKLALIERPGVDDDMNTINTLKNRNLVISITEKDLINLDYALVKSRAEKEIDIEKLNAIHNHTKRVCEKILEFIV